MTEEIEKSEIERDIKQRALRNEARLNSEHADRLLRINCTSYYLKSKIFKN